MDIKPTKNFVFVHGGWHTGAHWNRTIRVLTAAGHRAIAIDLPRSGLGQDCSVVTQDIGLRAYQEAVTSAIKRAATHGPVTLVGHSLGGLTITLAGEAVPDVVERLVYITAYVPVRLPNSAAYRQLPEGAASRTTTVLTGFDGNVFLIDPGSTDNGYLDQLRDVFYHDVPTEVFKECLTQLVPDLPARATTEDARGTLERWGAIPRTFVRCTEDRALLIALQDRMIREADEVTPNNPFEVYSLVSSHSPFASMPQALAKILASAGRRRHPDPGEATERPDGPNYSTFIAS